MAFSKELEAGVVSSSFRDVQWLGLSNNPGPRLRPGAHKALQGARENDGLHQRVLHARRNVRRAAQVRRGPRGHAVRLGVAQPRSRRADLLRPARSHRLHPGGRRPRLRARGGLPQGRASGSRVRPADYRHGARPRRRRREPEHGHRRDRGAGQQGQRAQRIRHPAVLHRGRHRDRRDHAHEVALHGPSPSGDVPVPAPAPHRGPGHARRTERARLHRGGNAYPGQLHARGRSRLSGALPSEPGQVLRAAAVPAAVQADAHGRRHRALLPDRPLLPRRGPARRPSA